MLLILSFLFVYSPFCLLLSDYESGQCIYYSLTGEPHNEVG